jgi:hypothetical protein
MIGFSWDSNTTFSLQNQTYSIMENFLLKGYNAIVEELER